jgi:hypothetical protein
LDVLTDKCPISKAYTMCYHCIGRRQAHNHSCNLRVYLHVDFGVGERIKQRDALANLDCRHQQPQPILRDEDESISSVLLAIGNDCNPHDAMVASPSHKLRLVISLLLEQHRQERTLFINISLLLPQSRHVALAIPDLDTSERAKSNGCGLCTIYVPLAEHVLSIQAS